MIDVILSVFFPNRCPYCRKLLKVNMTECDDCRNAFPTYPKRVITTAGIECIAPFAYEAKVRDSILSYKFRGVSFNAKSYIKAMCHTIEYFDMQDSFETVTFVPLTAARKRERGFNQSELIAKGIAEYFHKQSDTLLKKIKHNRNQHDLNAEERKLNVKGVYDVSHEEKVKDRKILLIDDIATTGNTLLECCHILKSGGAENIICMTIAITGAF